MLADTNPEGRDLSFAGKLLHALPCGCRVHENCTPVQCEEAGRLWKAVDDAATRHRLHSNFLTQAVADKTTKRLEDHFKLQGDN